MSGGAWQQGRASPGGKPGSNSLCLAAAVILNAFALSLAGG